MPLTTCSGRLPKAPPQADQVSTHTSKDGNEAHSCPGPKLANVSLQLSFCHLLTHCQVPCAHARPKPCPLPRSEHSNPLTSSAEEDIFFSNFARHSFIRNKSNDASEEPEAQLPDGKFTDSYHLLTTADDLTDDTDNDIQQVEGLFSLSSSTLNNSTMSLSFSQGQQCCSLQQE